MVEVSHRLVEMGPEGEPQRLQLVALREAEAPRQRRELRRPPGRGRHADAVERRLHVKRNGRTLELEEVRKVRDGGNGARRTVVLERRNRA